jgi:hypothetical protein
MSSSGFTSAAIPSLAAPSGFFSPPEATKIHLSRQSNLPSKLRTRLQIPRASLLRRCWLCLFLAQSALVRFDGSLSPLNVTPQNLVQFLRPDWFCEIPIHPSSQAFLSISFHGVRR